MIDIDRLLFKFQRAVFLLLSSGREQVQ